MSQPQWITKAGSLGTIPENVFYQVSVSASAGVDPVYYQLIAGHLPGGMVLRSDGVIEGIPNNLITVDGQTYEVSEELTSKFAIRAYTVQVVDGVILVDQLADRTFTITVSGQNIPDFITPPGNIANFYDGSKAEVQIEFFNADPSDTILLRVISGELPNGMYLNPYTGLISGVIIPVVGPSDTAQPGFDATQFDQYPFDFTTGAISKNYQFTIEISDGKATNTRTFEIYVIARNTLRADTTTITADNTVITADETPVREPVMLTPEGNIGSARADNYYAFRF